MRIIFVSAVLLAAHLACAEEIGSTAAAVQPGDEQLSCEQIYAQGMAESRRDQAAREQKNAERKRESVATMALVGSAMMTGGLAGTGPAAQAAAERQADGTIAELGAQPQVNPRMQHLKQLWAQKHCMK